jgi:hypothetical protein
MTQVFGVILLFSKQIELFFSSYLLFAFFVVFQLSHIQLTQFVIVEILSSLSTSIIVIVSVPAAAAAASVPVRERERTTRS